MAYRKQFPLVRDDEVIIVEAPVMDLYDDRDLISNIKGPYQERQFTTQGQDSSRNGYQSQIEQDKRLSPSQETQTTAYIPRKKQTDRSVSYGKIARDQAREDLKRKRSAPYLNFDKPSFKSKELPAPKLTQRDKDQAQWNDYTQAANRLRQTNYITAELRPVYQHVAPVVEEVAKKNNYDFLKTSQVYNYQENQTKKENKIAQELDLTRFEQWKQR